MMSITSTRYLSDVDWLQDVVQGKDLILCGVSTLEFLELFNGYVNESKIQVYAKSKGQFDNIDYINFDGVLCTTVNQTINDMLANYDNIDELAFLEALSNYYFANDESFDNLKIKPENLNIFNQVKQIAIEYYCED